MSCQRVSEQISNYSATVSGAVSSLSSRQAFLVGTAAGSATTGVIAAVVANRRKIADKFRRSPAALQPTVQSKPKPIPIPGTSGSPPVSLSRPKPMSIPGVSGSQPSLSSRSKPMPIPGISNSPHASSAKPKPIPIPGMPNSPPASLAKPKPIPIPLLNTPAEKTHLKPDNTISIHSSEGNSTISGYRLHRPNGTDTGLALTPHLDKNNAPQDGWVVTHSQTGKLIDGPFAAKKEAHKLATRLATITTWSQNRMPTDDLKQAAAIIKQHRQGAAG